MNETAFGAGLVACLLLVACQGNYGVQEAGGSNPLTQTRNRFHRMMEAVFS